MNLIEINGTALPSPTSYSVSLADLDSANSGRSETGVMNRERIRSNVAKIQAAFTNLTEEELSLVTRAIAPEEFSVRFYHGDFRTADMYVGDRSISLKFIDDSDKTVWDVSFDLVEY